MPAAKKKKPQRRSTRFIARPWMILLGFAAVVGIAYLPYAFRLTYFRDDWYYAYDAMVGPAGIFHAMFASDRPARGFFYQLYLACFGTAALPYHLGMYFWRVLGGLAVYWLLILLWPRQRTAALGAGLLFALYPGFTWWVAGIEYQPMAASAALMVVSFALSMQSLRASRAFLRYGSMLGAILTGWLYLALVEYAAGMEILRLLLIHLEVQRSGRKLPPRQALFQSLRVGWPHLLIPAGFLLWRVFLFSSERKATDIGLQLGSFFAEPVQVGAHWLLNFLLSLINVVLSAWVAPLVGSFFSGKLREILPALAIGAAAVAVAWLVFRSVAAAEKASADTKDAGWPGLALALGGIGLLVGILPVIAANRYVAFPSYSHYALPASLGLVFVVAGSIALLGSGSARLAVWLGLISLSAFAHQGLGTVALREEKVVASFWHQVAWRVPALRPGTTLLVYYPGLEYGEDTDIVWGPANFIYYSAGQSQIPVHAAIAAISTQSTEIEQVLLRGDERYVLYRAHDMIVHYDNLLIISQPAEEACARVIDARWPEISTLDQPILRLLAGTSHIENVTGAAGSPALPESVFGPEPAHGWCLSYQRAELARQREDWAEVVRLGEEARAAGQHPNDQIEWMPFLQAYAELGKFERVKEISTKINTQRYYKIQACQNLSAMPDLSAEMQIAVREMFCGGVE